MDFIVFQGIFKLYFSIYIIYIFNILFIEWSLQFYMWLLHFLGEWCIQNLQRNIFYFSSNLFFKVLKIVVFLLLTLVIHVLVWYDLSIVIFQLGILLGKTISFWNFLPSDIFELQKFYRWSFPHVREQKASTLSFFSLEILFNLKLNNRKQFMLLRPFVCSITQDPGGSCSQWFIKD